MTIGSSGTKRFIFDSDGDSHQDVGTAWTNFDSHDDAAITRSLAMVMDPASIVQNKWDDFGRDNLALIQEVGLIQPLTDEEKANGDRALVNMSLLTRIHNGQLGQLNTYYLDLKEELQAERNQRIALEARLNLLEN